MKLKGEWTNRYVRWIGIIHLVRTQNFPKNFIPRDTHTNMCVSGAEKCFSENLRTYKMSDPTCGRDNFVIGVG